MRVVAAYLLFVCMLVAATTVDAQDEAPRSRRMGAYQCIECVAGGFLSGIRQGGHGRVRREFPSYRRLCVVSYQDIDGEQYVFFQLEPMGSSTEGAWSVRRERAASGINASGDRYASVILDDGGWPDGGDWGVKSNSWNAECYDPGTQ